MKYPTLRISRPQVKEANYVEEVTMRQPLNYKIYYNNGNSAHPPKSAPLPRKVYKNHNNVLHQNQNGDSVHMNGSGSVKGFSKLQRLMNRHGKNRSRTISRENLAVTETNGYEHGFENFAMPMTNGHNNRHANMVNNNSNGSNSNNSDNSDYGELRAIVRRIEMRQQNGGGRNFASNTLPTLKSPNARKRLVFDYVPQSVMHKKRYRKIINIIAKFLSKKLKF